MKKISIMSWAMFCLLGLNQCTTNQCSVREQYAQNILAQMGKNAHISPERILRQAVQELEKCPKPSEKSKALMANCHHQMGVLVEDSSALLASQHYIDAVRLADVSDKKNLTVYQHALARTYIGLQDLEQAELLLKKIKHKLTEFPLLEGRLAYNKIYPPYNGGKKTLEKAIEAFESFLKDKQVTPAMRSVAYYEAGLAYWKLENQPKAQQYFDAVRFTDRLPQNAYYDMASFRLAKGDTIRAKQLLDNGLACNLNHADYMYYYGQFELDALRKKYNYNLLTNYQCSDRDVLATASAIASFKKAYSKSKKNDLSVTICKSLIWAEHFANVVPSIPLSALPESLLNDDNSEAAFYVGISAANEGKLEKALMKFKKASENKFMPNNIRAMSYFWQGLLENEPPVSIWNQAIQFYPNYPDALYKRGEFYTEETQLADTNKVNHYQLALQDFESVLNLNPLFWQAHLQKGIIYAEKKQYQNALQSFEFLIQKIKNAPTETHNTLKTNANLGKGIVLYRRSREAEAQKNDRKEAINCLKYAFAESDTTTAKTAYERRRFTATYYLYKLYQDKQNEETFKYVDYLKQYFERFKTESKLTAREKRLIKGIEVELGQQLEAYWVNPLLHTQDDTLVWYQNKLDLKLRIQSFYPLKDFEFKLDGKVIDDKLPNGLYTTNLNFPKDTTYKLEISLKNKLKSFQTTQYITVDSKKDTFQWTRKYALVIGNNSYTEWGVLQNAVNDAKIVKEFLEKAGFKVRFEENVDSERLKTALLSVKDSSENYDLTMLYYAGHGFNTGGSNYLVPTNASKTTPKAASFDTKSLFQSVYRYWVQPVNKARSKGKAFVWLFDACREEIEDASDCGNLNLDLNREQLLPNTVILSTAALGQTASDVNPCKMGMGNFAPRLQENFDTQKAENWSKEMIQLLDTKSVVLCGADKKMVPVVLSNLSVKILLLEAK